MLPELTTPDLLPRFFPQCCDTVRYLLQGEICATSNQCYDQLRPIGAQLWFSLPYRLGLRPDTLIVLHWFMLLVSIALSVKALTALAKPAAKNKNPLLFFISISTIAHLVFFWPVMQYALADAPATLLALIAFWLLLMEGKQPRGLVLAFAGLLLGTSAWIRFAYFYPLLGMLAVYILLWIGNTQRRRAELLLLTALLPIVIQYAATFFHHKTFSFLAPHASERLFSEHALSKFSGWDTTLSRKPYVWKSSCKRKMGIERALQEQDFSAVACLTASRFNFAFGSYAPDTYIFSEVNLLPHSTIEHVGRDSRWQDWRTTGIRVQSADTFSPDGSQRPFNEKLIAFAPPRQQDRIITAEERLPLDMPYTFSVWLWAPVADTIDIILREKAGTEIARNTVNMTTQPTRFFVSGLPGKSSSGLQSFFYSDYVDLEVVIGATQTSGASFADRPMAEFYAWGAQLEQSAVMTDYQQPDVSVTRSDFRHWSPAILIANMVAMLSVALLFFISRNTITHLQIISAVFMALVVAEVIFTLPEQRFVIGVEVYIWICFALVFYKITDLVRGPFVDGNRAISV